MNLIKTTKTALLMASLVCLVNSIHQPAFAFRIGPATLHLSNKTDQQKARKKMLRVPLMPEFKTLQFHGKRPSLVPRNPGKYLLPGYQFAPHLWLHYWQPVLPKATRN